MFNNQRAGYGKQIVHALSALLTKEYGKGFTRRNIFNMMRFAEIFPDFKIVSAAQRQLSWTHFKANIGVIKNIT